MNSQKLCSLFKDYRTAVQNIQKIQTANSWLRTTKGTRLMRKARKYRRPEDLVDPYYYGKGPKEEVKSALQSIKDRGFAKEQPSYQPPKDVEQQLQAICKKVFGSESNSLLKDQPLNDPLLKFKVLTKCIDTFKKNVPNSYLHELKTVKDVLNFYQTPIDGCTHFDAMVRDSDKLPPNLHISEEVHFNPNTDNFFDGLTAYPGRKRIVHTKTRDKFEKVVEWPHI